MSDIIEQQMDIAASLWLNPADWDELRGRNFLKTISSFGIAHHLDQLLKKGWIYQQGETYFTYKKTITDILNTAGYELPEQKGKQ